MILTSSEKPFPLLTGDVWGLRLVLQLQVSAVPSVDPQVPLPRWALSPCRVPPGFACFGSSENVMLGIKGLGLLCVWAVGRVAGAEGSRADPGRGGSSGGTLMGPGQVSRVRNSQCRCVVLLPLGFGVLTVRSAYESVTLLEASFRILFCNIP